MIRAILGGVVLGVVGKILYDQGELDPLIQKAGSIFNDLAEATSQGLETAGVALHEAGDELAKKG
ncbi:hypothetical protein [Sphingobium phenoxybenzoativorans]|uniref:hypothetical protein n=1 Tax=Sphingobium phenoxybenzoativorans TaxID=1592790 RepID=UPI0008733D72|nr:hypothetical protein [Sphingobium phenoxybenzoativorans]